MIRVNLEELFFIEFEVKLNGDIMFFIRENAI